MKEIKVFLRFLKGCYKEDTQVFFDYLAYGIMIFIVSLFSPDLAECLAVGMFFATIIYIAADKVFNRFVCFGLLIFQVALYAIVLVLFRQEITVAILAHFIMSYISAILVTFLISDLTIPKESQYKAPIVRKTGKMIYLFSRNKTLRSYKLLDRCESCNIPFVERGESGKSFFLGFIETNVSWSRIRCQNCGFKTDEKFVFMDTEFPN